MSLSISTHKVITITQSSGTIVRKIFSRDDRGRWLNEVAAYKWLLEHGALFIPRLLRSTETDSVCEIDLGRIRGRIIQFRSESGNPSEHLEALGNTIRQLHSFPVPNPELGYGPLHASSDRATPLESFITSIERGRKALRSIRHPLANKTHFWNLLSQRAAAQSVRSGQSLIHRDLRADNILVDQGGQIAVVDWEVSAIGSPLQDLARMFLSEFRDDSTLVIHFCAGYLAQGEELDQEPLAFFKILYCLEMSSYLVKRGFGTSHSSRFFEMTIKDLEVISQRL